MSQNPPIIVTLTADDGWRRSGVVAAPRGRVAWKGLRPRPGDRAMLIRCRSVHTARMREALRIVAVSGDGRVVASTVAAPWRVVSVGAARWILELPQDDPGPGVGSVVSGLPTSSP